MENMDFAEGETVSEGPSDSYGFDELPEDVQPLVPGLSNLGGPQVPQGLDLQDAFSAEPPLRWLVNLSPEARESPVTRHNVFDVR